MMAGSAQEPSQARRPSDHPFSPRNHLQAFRFESVDNVETDVCSGLAEAYQVGQQRRLV
jgi:hypothetical protein